MWTAIILPTIEGAPPGIARELFREKTRGAESYRFSLICQKLGRGVMNKEITPAERPDGERKGASGDL